MEDLALNYNMLIQNIKCMKQSLTISKKTTNLISAVSQVHEST